MSTQAVVTNASSAPTAVQRGSKARQLPYSTYYNPDWTAYEGSQPPTQILRLDQAVIRAKPPPPPARKVTGVPEQFAGVLAGHGASRTSSATTTYSDYSTLPPAYRPLADILEA
jgi:hypothetical protein